MIGTASARKPSSTPRVLSWLRSITGMWPTGRPSAAALASLRFFSQMPSGTMATPIRNMAGRITKVTMPR